MERKLKWEQYIVILVRGGKVKMNELKSTGTLCHFKTDGRVFYCGYNHKRKKCKNCIKDAQK